MYRVTMEVVADPYGNVAELIEEVSPMHPGLQLTDTGRRPNGNFEVSMKGSLKDLYVLLSHWCGNDDEQALWHITQAYECKVPPPPTTLDTLERMSAHCLAMENDCDELRVMGDMDEELADLRSDVEDLTYQIQSLIDDKQ